MTTAQILIGFGLIILLAVGSQVLASRLRNPALIVLRPAARRPFFETLVQLIISVLFISISATVTPQLIRHLILPALVLVAVLVIVARPVAALAATLKTDLPKGERAFIGWMAPRGIVAAATASTFGAGLAAKGIGGAAKILPATFLVIVPTVTRYGLTAAPGCRCGRHRPPHERVRGWVRGLTEGCGGRHNPRRGMRGTSGNAGLPGGGCSCRRRTSITSTPSISSLASSPCRAA